MLKYSCFHIPNETKYQTACVVHGRGCSLCASPVEKLSLVLVQVVVGSHGSLMVHVEGQAAGQMETIDYGDVTVEQIRALIAESGWCSQVSNDWNVCVLLSYRRDSTSGIYEFIVLNVI